MKLAIVGAEEKTRGNAPWDDESFDIWLVNEWAMSSWCRRFTATLDVHWPQIYTDPKYDRGTGYWKWLREKRGKPVYMQDVDPDIPDSVKFPLQEINAEFLSTLKYENRPVKNFRTSMSFCLALAMYQGYDQIDFYGIELAGNEFKGQRANFAFWVGVAAGRKVKINLHCSRGVFDGPLYGYEGFMKTNSSYDYIVGITQQMEEKKRELNMMEGALLLANQMLEKEQESDDALDG